jgi:hypothetical protein
MFAFSKLLPKELASVTDASINTEAAAGGFNAGLWEAIEKALEGAKTEKARLGTLVSVNMAKPTPTHKSIKALCDAFFSAPKLGYKKATGLKVAECLCAVTGMINGHCESVGKPAPFPTYGCPLAFYDCVNVEPSTAAEVDAAIKKESAKDAAKAVKQAESALTKAIAALELLDESQTKQLFAACANKLSLPEGTTLLVEVD